jgi:hypothetical protein
VCAISVEPVVTTSARASGFAERPDLDAWQGHYGQHPMANPVERPATVRYWHRTYAAEAILAGGFKDGTGTYLTDREHTGVWLSDIPVERHDQSDTLLAVDLPVHLSPMLDAEHEWVEDGKGFREWLVPAAILNEHGTVTVVDES